MRYRTYQFPNTRIPCLTLRFEPVPLAAVNGSLTHQPSGFVVGPLAVHPLRDWSGESQRTLFRISHRGTGWRVVDMDDLSLAIGLADALRGLDWSGTIDELTQRNREAVMAAVKSWTFEEDDRVDA